MMSLCKLPIIRLLSAPRILTYFAANSTRSEAILCPHSNQSSNISSSRDHLFLIRLIRQVSLSSDTSSLSKDTQKSQETNYKAKIRKPTEMSEFIDDNGDLFEPDIAHGESVVDRKSVFQGHCTHIHRVEHVEMFLSKLKENKKIENAFHNMWAYRIDKRDPEARVAGKSAAIVQDCDDDGEQAAGGRLLTLLQILNVVNVMVVVTRWYGGIQLGPARFKHINNAARDSLVKGGFVDDGGGQNAEGGSAANSGSTAQSKGKKSGKNKKR